MSDSITIIRQGFGISLGDIGDPFEFARDSDTKQIIILDEIEDAVAYAQLSANAAKRPTRVLKVSECAFLKPQREIDPETAS